MSKSIMRRRDPSSERAAGSLALTANAVTVLENRYLNRDEAGRVIETPEELFRRVAHTVAAVETAWGVSEEDVTRAEEAFYEIMGQGIFMPNSPTLMNAGRRLGMLSACFVLPLEDSIPGIMETARQIALVQRAGGGTGIDLSALRPKGSIVRSSGGTTEGPLSFLRMLSAVTDAIQQGAFRRGANMGMMRIDHPDIIAFIRIKEDLSKVTNYNLSVSMTDEFMRRRRDEAAEPHVVVNPLDGSKGFLRREDDQVDYEPVLDGSVDYWTVGQLWDLIIEKAWESGEPGLIFIDEVNRKNQTPHVFEMVATNPCGEQPLGPYEACNLGSINLAKFYKEPAGRGRSRKSEAQPGLAERIDWDGLADGVRTAVRFLDDVVEVNKYPTPEIEASCRANRKIGLGVMGWADMLFKLGIPYDSEDALELARHVGGFIQKTAWDADTELAEQRGVFPNWQGSVWDVEHERKMRNAHCVTIAPTGTISIIAGCSGGIEPIFSLAFTRQVLDGKKLTEVNPLFQESLERAFAGDSKKVEDVIEHVASTGSIQDLDLPDPIKRIYRTSQDIAPEWHVRMQAAWQEHTDAAVSKCVAEGTLVWSEKGLVPIEELSPEGRELDPDSFVEHPTRLFSEQGEVEAREIYYGGQKPTRRLTTRSGFTLEATPNHRVRVAGPDGTLAWRRVDALWIGDEIVIQAGQDYWGSSVDLSDLTARLIRHESSAEGGTVVCPQTLTTELAWLLGALLREDRTIFDHEHLDIVERDEAVRNRLRETMKRVFDVDPVIVTRPDAPCLRYRSLALKAFLVDGLGLSPIWKLRVVPPCIRRAPRDRVIAFLEGLLGGSLEGDLQLRTVSERLAREVQQLLLNAGKIARLEDDGHGLVLHLRRSQTVSMIKRSRRLLARVASGEDAIEDPPDAGPALATCPALLLADPIVHLETGSAVVWDFHVPENHCFTAAGMLNHNTINLPHTAKTQDVESAYLLAHELACKGITVYRDGSRPIQPMALKGKESTAAEKAPPAGPSQPGPRRGPDGTFLPMKLPVIMPCVRVRQLTPFGNMHVKISVEPKNGLEREVFAQLGKGGDVANSDLEAICRILSLFLRCNGSIKAAVNQLEGIGSSLSVPSKEGRIMSLADGLSAALKKYLHFKEHYGLQALLLGEVDLSERVAAHDHNGPDLQSIFKIKCPACDGVLAFVEGCVKCHSCGFSQC